MICCQFQGRSSSSESLARDLPDLTDNRAFDVPCYQPGYTLVEKLQTISTKFRRYLEVGSIPQNFLRHYYDIYCLLGDADVQAFIGAEAYVAHKEARFPAADNKMIAENPVFDLSDRTTRDRFARAYAATSALYYRGQPSLVDILGRIQEYSDRCERSVPAYVKWTARRRSDLMRKRDIRITVQRNSRR